jgi:hypothetical protein
MHLEQTLEMLPSDDEAGLDTIFGPSATKESTAGGTFLPVEAPRDARWHFEPDGRLVFDPDTTYDEWERDVLRPIEVGKRIHCALGDALAFGEGKFGERASQVMEATPPGRPMTARVRPPESSSPWPPPGSGRSSSSSSTLDDDDDDQDSGDDDIEREPPW